MAASKKTKIADKRPQAPERAPRPKKAAEQAAPPPEAPQDAPERGEQAFRVPLGSDYFLVRADARNWQLVRTQQIKKGKHAGEMTEVSHGYFGSGNLAVAVRDAIELMVTEGESPSGLRDFQFQLELLVERIARMMAAFTDALAKGMA